MGAARQRFVDLCRDVLRPLIEADEGKLFLVSADEGELVLHLGGTCAGCPGAPLTIRTLIEPAVRAIDPSVRVVVTVGAKRPENAVLVEADEDIEVDTDVGLELHRDADAGGAGAADADGLPEAPV
jgi:Fe-S cluster biogenesis protein NfuA